MRLIHKYELPICSYRFGVNLPIGSEILSVQLQNGIPKIWVSFEYENEHNNETRYFKYVGTGITYNPGSGFKEKYITTIQDGNFVWHLFEEIYCGY